MSKILYITLHRKWFDLVASGEKTVEFRQATPYWRARLLDERGNVKRFDEIHARNGYRSTDPLVVVQHLGGIVTDASACDPRHGEELDGMTICLALGSVLRLENCQHLEDVAHAS